VGANSRNKGKNGERELCRLLADIFSGSFVRVPNSGAAVGGKNAHRRQTLSKSQDRSFRGDIIPPDHLPRLVIESKAYKEFRFHALLQPGPCAMLDDWIGQTIDIIDAGDQWFVAFKVCFHGWYLAIPESECPGYTFQNHCAYTGAHGAFRVTALVDFLRRNRDLVMQKAGPQIT